MVFEYEEGSILDPRAFQPKPISNLIQPQKPKKKSKPFFTPQNQSPYVVTGTKVGLDNLSKKVKSVSNYFSPQAELQRTRAKLKNYQVRSSLEMEKAKLEKLKEERKRQEFETYRMNAEQRKEKINDIKEMFGFKRKSIYDEKK